MRRPTREDLVAYAVGALDPGRAADVDQELLSAPELVAEIAEIRRSIRDGEPVGWALPPPGAASGRSPLRVQAAPVAVMGAHPTRLRLRLEGAAADALVVVLLRRAGAWWVADPRRPEDALAVSDLPTESGTPVVEIATTADAERVAVALVPPGIPVAWSGPPQTRWEAVQRAVEDGRVPAITLDLSTR